MILKIGILIVRSTKKRKVLYGKQKGQYQCKGNRKRKKLLTENAKPHGIPLSEYLRKFGLEKYIRTSTREGIIVVFGCYEH